MKFLVILAVMLIPSCSESGFDYLKYGKPYSLKDVYSYPMAGPRPEPIPAPPRIYKQYYLVVDGEIKKMYTDRQVADYMALEESKRNEAKNIEVVRVISYIRKTEEYVRDYYD